MLSAAWSPAMFAILPSLPGETVIFVLSWTAVMTAHHRYKVLLRHPDAPAWEKEAVAQERLDWLMAATVALAYNAARYFW